MGNGKMLVTNQSFQLQSNLIGDRSSGKVREIFLVLFSIVLFIFLAIGSKFSISESFIIGYQAFLILRFINNISYTLCFFDFICLYSALQTLVMPVIGYRLYNQNNELAHIWGWYMRVPEDEYYSFLIPANLALFFGLNYFTRKFSPSDFKSIINKLPEIAKDKGKTGIVLTIIGFIAAFLEKFSVGSYIFHLLAMLKYVGPLYIYFSDLVFRKKILIVSVVIFFIQTLATGMFGEFVMYLLLTSIVLLLKGNFRFVTKLVTFLIGFFLIVIVQSIKSSYRTITWVGKTVNGLSTENSSKAEIFGSLFIDKLQTPEKLFDEKGGFMLYTRMNQGFLISRTMDYVPRVEPFANGETILRSVAAVLIPRFLWPDKPESGGRENLSRFVGIKKKLVYSMNIGPYGEAYGNFGSQAGIVFMLVYGLFLSLLLKLFISNCLKRPTLVLWAPLLFYYTLTVETDILTTLNSFIKGAIFVLIIFWISKRFFGTSL